MAIVLGVLAGLVQMLGLLRWVYLVPWLARAHAEAKPEDQRSIEITFEAFHRFLGVGVGEHLGYLLTGLWSVLFGFALMSSTELSEWFGWAGIVIGLGLMVASLEFLGPNEERGWALAATPSRSSTSRGRSGCSRWGSRSWSEPRAQPCSEVWNRHPTYRNNLRRDRTTITSRTPAAARRAARAAPPGRSTRPRGS